MSDLKEHFKERAAQYETRQAIIKAMPEEDYHALRAAVKTIDEAVSMLFECGDLYLSDLHKLHDALHKLRDITHPWPSEHERERFAELGIKYNKTKGAK